jgi:protein gp37
MGDKTTIEWTDATWNPVRGCSIVSKGCTNCYAMKQAHRSSGAGGAYEGLTKLTKGGPVWTGAIRELPELLDQPLRWQRPRRIFVNSMSDLFHEDVHGDFIDEVLDVIRRCNYGGVGHTFQILTKRAARMHDFMKYYQPLPNLWLGVSVEDQAAAEERIPLLLQTPAAVRWISAEPLLGPIDLLQITHHFTALSHEVFNSLYKKEPLNRGQPRPRLDWVVAGGESGPGARPMHPDWARSLRDQCAAAGVAFFFKQWGSWTPYCAPLEAEQVQLEGCNMRRVAKKAAGRQLDGRTHDEYPA